MNKPEILSFYGIPVSIFTKDQLVEYLKWSIKTKNQIVCYGYSLPMLPYYKKEPEIFHFSKEFDLFVTDGSTFFKLLKIFKVPVKYDISIPNLTRLLLRLANENKYSLMLLGARPEVNLIATEKIRNQYENIEILDGIHGYFENDQEQEVVNLINKKNPDILFVGMSSPKKEKFIADWRNQIKSTIIVPCGGMIDVYAGVSKQTPTYIKKLGLAWFYRFIQEPRRLFGRLLLSAFKVIVILLPSLFVNVKLLSKKSYNIPKLFDYDRPDV